MGDDDCCIEYAKVSTDLESRKYMRWYDVEKYAMVRRRKKTVRQNTISFPPLVLSEKYRCLRDMFRAVKLI